MDRVGKADEVGIYRIVVSGTLGTRWSDWFGGLAVTIAQASDGSPISTLSGSIDQATLRGVLNRIWDLNLTLISVVLVEAAEGCAVEEVRDD